MSRTDQLRMRGKLQAASLLLRLAHFIAPARMAWWAGTPLAGFLRRLARDLTR